MAKKDAVSHKKKAWNVRTFILTGLGALIVPVLGAVLTSLMDKMLSSDKFSERVRELVEWVRTKQMITIVVIALLCLTALAFIIYKWDVKKERKETWVRHSSRYHRLEWALCEFLMTKKQAEDFNRFVDKFIAIVERNYDQFELNMSKNGLAPVPEMEGDMARSKDKESSRGGCELHTMEQRD